jgi:hypothetical protein
MRKYALHSYFIGGRWEYKIFSKHGSVQRGPICMRLHTVPSLRLSPSGASIPISLDQPLAPGREHLSCLGPGKTHGIFTKLIGSPQYLSVIFSRGNSSYNFTIQYKVRSEIHEGQGHPVLMVFGLSMFCGIVGISMGIGSVITPPHRIGGLFVYGSAQTWQIL